MSVVNRKSIALQLDEEMLSLAISEEDKALCRTLYRAILAVQRPALYGELPLTVRKAISRWDGKVRKAHRSSDESIRTQLKFADGLGLKRTRGNSQDQATAFDWVAKRLRISPDTVANKAGRQLPRTKRKR